MTILLTALLFSTAPASTAAPANAAEISTADPLTEIALEVRHQPLLEKQFAMTANASGLYVREDSTAALTETHGFTIVEDASLPTIIVTLSWEDYETGTYRIELATRHPGQAEQLVSSYTATCVNSALLTGAVVNGLPEAVEQLRNPPKVVEEESGDTDPIAERQSVPPKIAPNHDEPSQRRPLGSLGKAGIGTGVGGLVVLAAGAAVFAQGEQADMQGQKSRDHANFRPPGIALMVGGSVAAATGIVLLVVDRRRPLKTRPDVSFTSRSVSFGLTAHF